MTSLLDYMDRGAARDGTVHFVRTREEARWSSLWRDAHERAAWITRTLPEDHTLAGLLEPSRACLAALLGCWLAGRTFASLPHPSRGMDVQEYKNQTKALIELAGGSVVATPTELAGMLDGVRTMTYDDFGRLPATPGSDRGRLVQFTSGSTDRPRGVVVDMDHIGANALAMAQSLRVVEGEVFFSWLPLSHDMGLVGMCLAPLAAFSPELGGASQVWLSDPREFLRNPVSWLRLGSDVGGTVTTAPNFALELVARRLRPGSGALDLSSLRCLIVGSETVSAATLRRFAAVTADHGFRERALCPAYGLAEATLAVTMVRPESPWTARPSPATSAPSPGQLGTDEVVALGPPVPEMQVRTGGTSASTGENGGGEGGGEIEISGPSVTHELLGRPAALAADGWLRTGDLGFLYDGELYFAGRTGDRIVVAGRNLDAGGLQRRLSSVPGVRAGCCAVISDGPHDDFAVVFEAAPGVSGDAERQALCRSVSDAAVRYAGTRPGRVLIVGRGRLPKTPSGKLQPHRLRAGLADGTVVPLAEVTTRRHVPPR